MRKTFGVATYENNNIILTRIRCRCDLSWIIKRDATTSIRQWWYRPRAQRHGVLLAHGDLRV